MSEDSKEVSIDYKRLSDQAISSIMMALQKGIVEEKDITGILRDFALVEDDGEMIVNNPPNFDMSGVAEEEDEDSPRLVMPEDE